MEIFANESKYNKETKILDLIKDVIILDKIQNVEIKSDNITYNKILEKITSNTKTEIKINDSHLVSGEDIVFLRTKFTIESDKPSNIKDKFCIF